MNVAKAVQLLAESKYAVALTGAGISTPSGIPDFRSNKNGLWQHVDPLEVASLTAFRLTPEVFYSWFRPLARLMFDAIPNPAHDALTELERLGILRTTITQNIDGLHQKSGTKNVLEVHGTLTSMTCVQCYTKHKSKPFCDSYILTGKLPHCPNCNGLLKPDAILFEEQLPQATWRKVEEEIKKSDLLIVVGSSLEVFPVASLPYKVVSRGGKLIIINNQVTYIDSRAELVLHEDAAEVLPQILEKLPHE